MRKELQQKTIARWPQSFNTEGDVSHTAMPRASCMAMAGSISSGAYAGTWNPWLRNSSRKADANDAMRQRLEAAKMESTRTCEVCGQPGALREGSWIKTLCDEHTTIN
jgi:hypothetical protein